MKPVILLLFVVFSYSIAQEFTKLFDANDLCRVDGLKHESLDKLLFANNHQILSSSQWNSSLKNDGSVNGAPLCSFTLNFKSLASPLKRVKTLTGPRLGTDSVVYALEIRKGGDSPCTPNRGTVTLNYLPDDGKPVEIVEPLCTGVDQRSDILFSRTLTSRNIFQLNLADIPANAPYIISITAKSDHPEVKKHPLNSPDSAVLTFPLKGDDGKAADVQLNEQGNKVIKIKDKRSAADSGAIDASEAKERQKRQYQTLSPQQQQQQLDYARRVQAGQQYQYNQRGYVTPARTGYGQYGYTQYPNYYGHRSVGRRVARIGGGIIAAIVIACLLCCGVCAGICFYLCSKRGATGEGPSWMKGMPAVYRTDAPAAQGFPMTAPQYNTMSSATGPYSGVPPYPMGQTSYPSGPTPYPSGYVPAGGVSYPTQGLDPSAPQYYKPYPA